MKNFFVLFFITNIFFACSEKKIETKNDFIIANGQMPNVVKDGDNKFHLVYGIGDSIFYSCSVDNPASFAQPVLVAVLQHAYSFATRGPQIAVTKNGIVITVCTSYGDIFSFYKDGGGNWTKGKKVNDVDTVAKEGLMALSADNDNVFTVWLDLRENKRNKIYGARSDDGGKTWSKNIMVYTSPDTTVCECCKPSVIVKGEEVYVMFRNFLKGNRDLYLIQSRDRGNSFEQAQKLGNGSWKLNGCPMDGGALAVNNNGQVETIWRRENKLYEAVPGSTEKEIGNGRNPAIETVDNKNFYAWVENGEVVIIKPGGEKKIIAKGTQPVLKALPDGHLFCVWENDKKVHGSIVKL